jgi:predicted AAA+ superfamily ATPase
MSKSAYDFDISMQELAPLLAGSNPWWADPAQRAARRGLVERPELQQIRAALELASGAPSGLRALALIGPRQVGKTTIARQIIDAHLDEGWPAGRVLYFDFSTALLTSKASVDSVLEHVKPGPGPRLIVLDEVTHAANWSRAIKELVDRARRESANGSDRIVILDSSASAVRTGVIDDLQGRTEKHWIEGLDYVSFLQRLLLPEESLDVLRARLPDPLSRYLAIGGLPGVSQYADAQEARARMRDDIVGVAIHRDVAQGMRDVARIQRLFTYLVRASGAQIKSSEVAKDLRAAGGEEALDTRTVDSWIELLVQAGLLRRLDPWTQSRKKQKAKVQLASVPKLYAFDPGLVTALDPSPDPLARPGVVGAVFESAVYRHLRGVRVGGRTVSIGFLRRKDESEIDFVLDDGEKAIGIEVTSDIDARRKVGDALALADDFDLARVLFIHGGRKRVERDHAIEIGIEDFLLDPRSILEEVFR